jgi:hypothetical protein
MRKNHHPRVDKASKPRGFALVFLTARLLISAALLALFLCIVCEIDVFLIAFEHSSICDVQDHSVVSWQSFRIWG